jgi:predicted P-loop ATPase
LPFWAYCADKWKVWDDRHQLRAEAVHRYRQGGDIGKWWIDEPELIKTAKAVQAMHVESDTWEEAIADHLSKLQKPQDGVTISEIFEQALGIWDKSKWSQNARTRIGVCLQNLGWDWKQRREAGERVRRYYKTPPEPQPEEAKPKPLWAPAAAD